MRTKIDTSALDLRDNVVTIKRVTKVVKVVVLCVSLL